ncbi:serine/threonine-protein phosphatase CPPED1-like [Clavelina lepadiformis]|uniref:Calcineurin-like phosphoesterase domain-containing protein n=1 Tax=Clavelina lepadiformis TaxID=159417 RepID=A0ABP0GXD6_CLALP
MAGIRSALIATNITLSLVFFYLCTLPSSRAWDGNQFRKADEKEIEHYTEAEEGSWSEAYYFIFSTDPQPGLIDMIEGGDGSRWDTELENTRNAMTAINNMKPPPKFLFVGGDIVNAFPGESLRKRQEADIREAFSYLNSSIPIFVISGNHDLGNVPTPDTMESYQKEFGDDYYAFWVGGVMYIALNSQCMFNSTYTEGLCTMQDVWLQKELDRAGNSSCQHVVILMHIPPFIDSLEESNTYFSIPVSRRLALLRQFSHAGVEKVFSGHYHRNSGSVWTEQKQDGSSVEIEVVVSSALGAQLGGDQSGIRVVKVLKNAISHSYYTISDIPESVTLP